MHNSDDVPDMLSEIQLEDMWFFKYTTELLIFISDGKHNKCA